MGAGRAAVAAVVVAAGVWLLGLRVSLNYDEGVYTQTALLLDRGLPLFSQVFSSQPPLFGYLMVPGWAVGGVVGIRVATACWSLVAVVAVHRIGLGLVGRWPAAAAAAFTAAVPTFAGMATRIEAEIPALALALVALALVTGRPGWRTDPGGRAGTRLVLAGVVFGAALAVKLLVAPMAAPLVLAAAGLRGTARVRSGRVAGLAAGAGATVLATGAAFWHGGDLWTQVVGFHLVGNGPVRAAVENLRIVAAQPAAAATATAGVLAVLVLGVLRRIDPVLAVWVLAAEAFLFLHQPLFDHHLVLAVPPCALAAAAAAGAVPGRVVRNGVLGVVLVLSLAVSGRELVREAPLQSARTSPAVARLAALPSDAVVVTDDQALATAAGLAVPAPLVDTSAVRIRTGSLTAGAVCAGIREADAVLFTAGGRFRALPRVRRCTGASMHLVWAHRGDQLWVRGSR